MFVRTDWRILLFLESLGGAVAPILFYVGIARTTAANAAMLQNGEPSSHHCVDHHPDPVRPKPYMSPKP